MALAKEDGVVEFIKTFENFFLVGMKKNVGYLHEPPDKDCGPVLNLGCGISHIPGAHNLDRPDWEAPTLHYESGTVAAVHCHHFLEHLDPDVAIAQLREIERVLIPTGNLYVTVPHSSGMLAFADLTHKSFWNEETFDHLFNNVMYDPAGKWDLIVVWQVIAGVSCKNLAVLAQIEKTRYKSD